MAKLFGCHGNILDKFENKEQMHHLHIKCFHMVNRLRKSVQYIRRYSTKCASFLAVLYLTFTNKLCQLWSYWTEFHKIFTQHRGVLCAVKAVIEIAISILFRNDRAISAEGK